MIAVGSGQCARSYALALCPVSGLAEGYPPQNIRRCSLRDRDQVLAGNLVGASSIIRVRNKYSCAGDFKIGANASGFGRSAASHFELQIIKDSSIIDILSHASQLV